MATERQWTATNDKPWGTMMMKKAVVLAVALIASVTSANAQGMPNYDTNDHCHQIAGGSYSLEQTCRGMERDAKQAVQRAPVTPDVWHHCNEIMASTGSYSLLETCLVGENSAKQSLGYTPSKEIVVVPHTTARAG